MAKNKRKFQSGDIVVHSWDFKYHALDWEKHINVYEILDWDPRRRVYDAVRTQRCLDIIETLKYKPWNPTAQVRLSSYLTEKVPKKYAYLFRDKQLKSVEDHEAYKELFV